MDVHVRSLRALIAVWLNDSQRNQNGVRQSRRARNTSVKRFEHSKGLDSALCEMFMLFYYDVTNNITSVVIQILMLFLYRDYLYMH